MFGYKLYKVEWVEDEMARLRAEVRHLRNALRESRKNDSRDPKTGRFKKRDE